MAYKRQELDFHLTPIGWSKEIVADYTVETWRLSVYQEFPWSKEQRAWRCIWHSLAWSEMERERLRATFAPPVQIIAAPVVQTTVADVEQKRA